MKGWALRYAELPLWLTKALALLFFDHYLHQHLLELVIAIVCYHAL